MGRSTIVSNSGDGLYQIRLDFNLPHIEKELKNLEEQDSKSTELLMDARETLAELRRARDEAKLGMEAVIEQWKENLITASEDVPHEIEEEVSFKQADNLFEALNDERADAGSTALTRSTALDQAARDYLATVAATGRLDDPKTPDARAKQGGYSADDEVTVACVGAPGPSSAIAAAAKLANKPTALSSDFEQAGAAYLYAPTTSWTYLWCVMLGTPEKEHSENLLDAINAERDAEDLSDLKRNGALDVAARRLLEVLAATGRSEDLTSDPETRADVAGFNVDTAVGVEAALAFDKTDAESVISSWMARSKESGALLGADYTQCGISYIYRRSRHYWCAFFAHPGSEVDIDWPDDKDEKDPAKDAADDSTEELDRIELPKTETFQPKKLPEAVVDFGKAVHAYLAGEREVSRLELEQEERKRRIAALQKIKSDASTPREIWACWYEPDIDDGTERATAEVGGWLDPARVNVLPASTPTSVSGRLRSAEVIPDALIFYHLSMEPGHFRWRPAWRYATITALTGDVCSITVEGLDARTMLGLGAGLGIVDEATAENVPIRYMECNGKAFEVGDEVLVQYDGQDRTKPAVIGFRREPRSCFSREHGWFSVTPSAEPAVGILPPYDEDGVVGKFLFASFAHKGFQDSRKFREHFRTQGGLQSYSWPDSLLRKRGSMFSGEMRKVVQILQGQDAEIAYSPTWDVTHGIFRVGAGAPHVIEVSAAGVKTWPLPVQEVSVAILDALSAQIGIRYWPLTAPDLPGDSEKTVLLSASDMLPFYASGNVGICSWAGWAFSASGASAQSICQTADPGGSGLSMSKRFLLSISPDESGVPISASLSEQESGVVWSNHLTGQILYPTVYACALGWQKLTTYYPGNPAQPGTGDITFPVHVFYIGETAKTFSYFCRREETESTEADWYPCDPNVGGVCYCPSQAGAYTINGELITHRGAYIVGAPDGNTDRENRTVKSFETTVTQSFQAAFGQFAFASPGGSQASYIYTNGGYSIKETEHGGTESSAYFFMLGLPVYEREGFFFYQRKLSSRAGVASSRSVSGYGGTSRYAPGGAFWVRGASPGGGYADSFYSVNNDANPVDFQTDACYSPIDGDREWISVTGPHDEVTDPGLPTEQTWMVFSVGADITKESPSSTYSETPAVETDDAEFAFYSSDGSALVKHALPDPGEKFSGDGPWQPSCGGATPRMMGAWLDVFTGAGVISEDAELGYSEKVVLGDLGEFASPLGYYVSGGTSPPAGGMLASGWMGIPFASDALKDALKTK